MAGKRKDYIKLLRDIKSAGVYVPIAANRKNLTPQEKRIITVATRNNADIIAAPADYTTRKIKLSTREFSNVNKNPNYRAIKTATKGVYQIVTKAINKDTDVIKYKRYKKDKRNVLNLFIANKISGNVSPKKSTFITSEKGRAKLILNLNADAEKIINGGDEIAVSFIGHNGTRYQWSYFYTSVEELTAYLSTFETSLLQTIELSRYSTPKRARRVKKVIDRRDL